MLSLWYTLIIKEGVAVKVNQFSYKQQTGLATIFTAETEDELIFLENLRSLIENEEGILSRKSFTFDNGTMSVDIDRKPAKPRQKKVTSPAAARVKGTTDTKK